jgi:hypothetical protein
LRLSRVLRVCSKKKYQRHSGISVGASCVLLMELIVDGIEQ